MATIKVSKLDAARRQLDSAIRLWFADDDPVTIHALAWAAYQIIQDINEKKGDKSITLTEMMRSVVKPEHLENSMQFFKKPMTFFKHANRDPHEILEFNPEMSEVIFVLAISGLGSLGEQMDDVQRVLMLWNRIHSPSFYVEGKSPLQDRMPVNAFEKLKRVDKHEFLNGGLLLMAESRLRR